MKLISKFFALTAIATLAISPSFADDAKTTTTTAAVTKSSQVLDNNDFRTLALLQAQALKDMFQLTPEQLQVFVKAYQDFAEGKADGKFDESTQNALTAKLSQFQKLLKEENLAKRKVQDKEALEKFKKNTPEAKEDKDGLVYLIKNEGTGKSLNATDNLNITYKGYFPDGTVFDENTVDFNIDGLVPGFRNCALKIKEKGSITCYIPSDLAYGDRSAGPIPPGAMLIFDITVNKVNPKADATLPKK